MDDRDMIIAELNRSKREVAELREKMNRLERVALLSEAKAIAAVARGTAINMILAATESD